MAGELNTGVDLQVQGRDTVVVETPTGQLDYLIVALVKLDNIEAESGEVQYGVGYNESRDDVVVVDSVGKIVDEATAQIVLDSFAEALPED